MDERQVSGERLVVSLLNTPRAKLDLIAFTGKNGERDFALRKMIWTGATGTLDAVKGYEIKLDLEVAKTLRVALKREFERLEENLGESQAGTRGPEAVRSA